MKEIPTAVAVAVAVAAAAVATTMHERNDARRMRSCFVRAVLSLPERLDKRQKRSSGVLFVQGSTVYTVVVKIMVASRPHVEKRLATRALFASRFAGPVRRTVVGVLAFAIEVDSIMLTCRVHANGKALVQAAIRTPIASRFVDEARSGSG